MGSTTSRDGSLQTVPDPPTGSTRPPAARRRSIWGRASPTRTRSSLTEFWNRSVERVASLDGTRARPGAEPDRSSPRIRDGSVPIPQRVDYVVTDGAASTSSVPRRSAAGLWRLIRTRRAAPAAQRDHGRLPRRLDRPRRPRTRASAVASEGTLEVSVPRVGWQGPTVPGEVEIRVGELVPAPFERDPRTRAVRHGVSQSTQPSHRPRVRALRWTATSGDAERAVPIAGRDAVPRRDHWSRRRSRRGPTAGADGRQLGVQARRSRSIPNGASAAPAAARGACGRSGAIPRQCQSVRRVRKRRSITAVVLVA